MTEQTQTSTPFILCILDGWGERVETSDNAIAHAKTPIWDRLNGTASRGVLEASETFVGLPSGQMGNSEVGHMNLGAGRVVMQDLPRIDSAIEEGTFAGNPALQDFIGSLKASGGTAHVMGLLSPGGVHSHLDHIAASAEALSAAGIPVAIHGFLDGRDTPPKSAEDFIASLENRLAPLENAQLATVCGRFHAMDRDKRWDRVENAWRTLILAEGRNARDAQTALADAYARGETDEFVSPSVLSGYAGMQDGDGIFMANFRADRARELLESLVIPDFSGFPVDSRPTFADTLGMVSYSEMLTPFHRVMFPAEQLSNTFGQVLSDQGLKQLRIAETEKYAHVTFFFNGGEEAPFDGEKRILVPSPDVETYDLCPAMSAVEVTDQLIAELSSDGFDVAIVNYANTDMVGHTGDFAAAIEAVETVDHCLGRLLDAVEAKGGAILITADHGNADMMRDPTTGVAHTAHTLSQVPVRLVGVTNAPKELPTGRLCDVAPTVLDAIGLVLPDEMTGHSLLSGGSAGPRSANPINAAAE